MYVCMYAFLNSIGRIDYKAVGPTVGLAICETIRSVVCVPLDMGLS